MATEMAVVMAAEMAVVMAAVSIYRMYLQVSKGDSGERKYRMLCLLRLQQLILF